MSLLLAALASAAPIGHDLRGAPVVADAPTVLVFWSMRSPDALEVVAPLQADGVPVVLVSLDAAADAALVRPWLHAHGLALPTIADPTGDLARRYALPLTGGAVVVDGDRVVTREIGAEVDSVALLHATGRSTVATSAR